MVGKLLFSSSKTKCDHVILIFAVLLNSLIMWSLLNNTHKRQLSSLNLMGPGYLAHAVDDDERGSQHVTVGGVFSHDVLVPQLDWHKGPEQLAQLLDQKVEFTLEKTKKQTKKTTN